MRLVEKVRQTIRRYGLLARGERVLVAVSGGPDSVSLLRALCALAPELGVSLCAAHFNHKLRGEESDEDARFVARLCAELGVALRLGEWTERENARGSLEAAAREARYRFLEKARSEFSARRIALGHTADDQAETLLLNLLRGAGTRGLAAMAPAGPGPLIRPLLRCTRAEVLEYLEQLGQPFRSDRSNEDRRFLRNRIRLELLPLLERDYAPGVREVLARTAELLRGDAEVLAEAGRDFFQQARIASAEREGEIVVNRERLRRLPVGAARLVVREACRAAAGSLADLAASHVESVLALAGDEGGRGSVWLPAGVLVRAGREGLVFSRCPDPPGEAEALGAPLPAVELAVPGVTELPAGRGRLTVRRASAEEARAALPRASPSEAWLDEAKLRLPLIARGWVHGDRMRPLGMGGRRKKLKKLFQEAGLGPAERARAVVVADAAGEILWVAGVRVSEAARVDENTKAVLHLILEGENRR